MVKNPSRDILGITDFVFSSLCGGSHVESSLDVNSNKRGCGTLAQAQASARVDVPTARVDHGVQHVCKFLYECLDMCFSSNRP